MGMCRGVPAPRADRARRLEAIHLGHLAIHEHQIVGDAPQGADGFQAVGGDIDAWPSFWSMRVHHRLVHPVVLGHQNGERRCRDAGGRGPVGAEAAAPRAAFPRASPKALDSASSSRVGRIGLMSQVVIPAPASAGGPADPRMTASRAECWPVPGPRRSRERAPPSPSRPSARRRPPRGGARHSRPRRRAAASADGASGASSVATPQARSCSPSTAVAAG